MTSFKDLVIDLRDTITQVFKVQIGEMESNFAFCLHLWACMCEWFIAVCEVIYFQTSIFLKPSKLQTECRNFTPDVWDISIMQLNTCSNNPLKHVTKHDESIVCCSFVSNLWSFQKFHVKWIIYSSVSIL